MLETIRGIPHLLDFWIVLTGLQVFGACGHGLTSSGALTTVQGLLNVLLFVPAAVALTVATGRPAFVTGAGAGLSVAVEAIQSLAPGLGRSCQLHDVIANRSPAYCSRSVAGRRVSG